MKLIILLPMIVLLYGCEMSTQQVVDKMAECKQNNLHADVYRAFGDGKVIDIQCVPQEAITTPNQLKEK